MSAIWINNNKFDYNQSLLSYEIVIQWVPIFFRKMGCSPEAQRIVRTAGFVGSIVLAVAFFTAVFIVQNHYNDSDEEQWLEEKEGKLGPRKQALTPQNNFFTEPILTRFCNEREHKLISSFFFIQKET